MNIQIAGPGCARCQNTEKIIRDTAAEMNLNARITHVDDYAEIARLGVRITPAVLIDGQIVLSGRVPGAEEARKLLEAKT